MKSLIKKIIPPFILYKIKEWKLKNSSNSFYATERALVSERVQFFGNIVKENDLVFDIGANEGNRIEPFLQLKTKVIAVEPQPACVKILKWKFGNKIVIEPIGIGANVTELEMFISESSTLSTFSKEWKDDVEKGRFKTVGWQKSIKVPVNTFDNLIEKYGTPAFVKIDVEGFELEVFKGLSKTIPMLCFEYAVPEQIDNLCACVDRLFEINNTTTFNYCIGEQMQFELSDWVTASEMKAIIKSKEFIRSAFGDIYAKQIEQKA